MTTFDSVHAIEILKQKCEADQEFTQLLTKSLCNAYLNARRELVFDSLNRYIWPRTTDDYLVYLNDFSHWAPRFCGQVAVHQPVKVQLEEVHTRLLHFYWLISQDIGIEHHKVLQDLPWFRNWLAEYEDLWELFINHADHLNDEILELLISGSPKSFITKQKNSSDTYLQPFTLNHSLLLTSDSSSDLAPH